jgi:hypothetical protein
LNSGWGLNLQVNFMFIEMSTEKFQ